MRPGEIMRTIPGVWKMTEIERTRAALAEAQRLTREAHDAYESKCFAIESMNWNSMDWNSRHELLLEKEAARIEAINADRAETDAANADRNAINDEFLRVGLATQELLRELIEAVKAK